MQTESLVASPSGERRGVRTAAGKALLIFLAAMIALTLANNALNELAVAQVNTVNPQRGALERRIDASGQLAAFDAVPVYAEAAVHVDKVHVYAGQQVQAGDPLFTLEAAGLADWVNDAQKTFDDAEKSLEDAQQAFAYAKADMNKYALDNYADAQKEVEKAQAAYDEAVASGASERAVQYKLEALEDAIRSRDRRSNVRDYFDKEKALAQAEQTCTEAREDLVDAKRIAGQPTVTAPFDAQVLSVDIQTGGTASTDGAALMLADLTGQLELTVILSEDEAKYLEIGDEATVSVGSTDYLSTVASITASIQSEGKYDVRFLLPGDAGRVGMSADAAIRKRTQNYDLLIPLSALRQDNTGYYVYTVVSREGALGAQTTVERADVSVVEQDSTRAAVQGGVSLRDSVASRSDRELHEGDRVRVKED